MPPISRTQFDALLNVYVGTATETDTATVRDVLADLHAELQSDEREFLFTMLYGSVPECDCAMCQSVSEQTMNEDLAEFDLEVTPLITTSFDTFDPIDDSEAERLLNAVFGIKDVDSAKLETQVLNFGEYAKPLDGTESVTPLALDLLDEALDAGIDTLLESGDFTETEVSHVNAAVTEVITLASERAKWLNAPPEPAVTIAPTVTISPKQAATLRDIFFFARQYLRGDTLSPSQAADQATTIDDAYATEYALFDYVTVVAE